jgi:hypothetical protein
MKRCVMAALAVLVSGTGVASANAADRTSEALLACANEADDAQRLRCFDSVVAGLRKAPAAPAATAPAASTPAAAAPEPTKVASTPETRFGARGDIKPDRHEELNEIRGTVTALGAKPHGELLVTLDNGQVWGEIHVASKVRLKTGDAVRIERGALGSYTLVAPNGRSSKVSRIR